MSRIGERPVELRPDRDDSDTWVKSYTYLRTAMVALLVGLGVAVLWQTGRQKWHLLESVSAYYYTPAQTIFAGALIGLGACMIALKGTRPVEEVLLNLGGMFAAVVAIVPTSRGEDYRRTVAVCKQAVGPLITQKAARGVPCPSTDALKDATTANVQNNMVALLVVGLLGLLATLLFTARDRRPDRRRDGSRAPKSLPVVHALGTAGRSFWWGFGLAVLVWVVGLVALLASTESLVNNAHYVAALGLFVCIVGVAFVNARRHREKQRNAAAGEQTKDDVDRGETVAHPELQAAEPSQAAAAAQAPAGLRTVSATMVRYRYTTIAVIMLVVTPVLALLWWRDLIPLFWLEIVVAAIFAAFWMVQTIELLPPESQPQSQPQSGESTPPVPHEGAPARLH